MNFKSKVKMILKIDKLWKTDKAHGVKIICTHFLIFNGSNLNNYVLSH